MFQNFDKKCVSSSSVYHDMGPVFMFTNENISGYLSASGGLSDQTVLSVAASGDHAFEAYLAGAKQVDTFDVNALQQHVMDLKAIMIQHMDYGSFMDFFFSKDSRLDARLLRPIADCLSPMQTIMADMIVNGCVRPYSYINNEYSLENITYLHGPDKFAELKQKLPQKIKFMHTDIMKLPYVLTQKYDTMMLSNIFESMFSDTDDAMYAMANFYNLVLRPLSQNLSDEGKIFLDYMWAERNCSREEYIGYWHGFLNAWNKLVVANGVRHHDFGMYPVLSTRRKSSVDLAMVMQQKKR